MEVLRLRLWRFRERSWWMREVCNWEWRKKKGGKIGLWGPGSRARPCGQRHGSCQLPGNSCVLDDHGLAGPCHHRHVPCQVSGHSSLKKISFFSSFLDNYLQNKLKQHKTKKIKAIKLVGCLPWSARLMSLAWRSRGFSILYPTFHKGTMASNWHLLPSHTWL